MTISYTDRIFWLRAGLGVAVGAISQLLFDSDYVSGILVAILIYIGTYYLVKQLWAEKFKQDEARKLITTGMPSYILLFLFFWILLFTLGLHFLHL